MTRLFLDSSVLFAAVYSTQGHARDIIALAARGEITLVVSQFVLAEAKRNLAENAPQRHPFFDYVLQITPFEFVQPTKRQVLAAGKHVVLKDAPIIAAARKAKVDMLVTLDRKHLLGKPELARYVRAAIVTPKEAMARLAQPN